MSVDPNDLFSAVVSQAKALNIFADTIQHEPVSAPGKGLSCAFWWTGTKASRSSGLSSVSAVVTFAARVYSSLLAKPEDQIDPKLMAAGHALMGAYAAQFTFNGQVRMVDLLGAEGVPLSCEPGYIPIDGVTYRCAELTIPCVVNDMWAEVP